MSNGCGSKENESIINFADNKGKIELSLNEYAYLWYGSFLAATVALILIFILKVLGVWAAQIRVDKGQNCCEHCIESVRGIISIVFVVLGVFSVILSGVILTQQLL